MKSYFAKKDISLLMTETIVLKVYKKFNVWIKYIYCRFITEFLKGKENKWKILIHMEKREDSGSGNSRPATDTHLLFITV